MVFNSIEFLIFFPLVCLGYAFCSSKIKRNSITQCFLLAVSLFFYACWKPAYLFLILISTVITFYSGIFIEKYPEHRKVVLILSLLSNLAILFFFKYYNWLTISINDIISSFGGSFSFPTLDIVLPVGISFYTFQALGYSIDVYRGGVKAERNFVTYALFVTFFPQLVAGPIERTENLLPQFKTDKKFDYKRITDGLKLAAWGMFMKVVIADRLAIYVNGIYNNVQDATGISLVLATFFFAIQVYCDFAGYSNIAIGCAQILGFKLMKNFNHPYFSKSIPEYWRRWHISLNSWFKDYLYFPVLGAKWNLKISNTILRNRKKARLLTGYIALITVWIATGIWHGAAWHFVCWGMLHGFYIVFSQLTSNFRRKIRIKLRLEKNKKIVRPWQFLQICITFFLVNVGYVLFRANNMHDLVFIFSKFLGIGNELKTFGSYIQVEGIKNVIRSLMLFNEFTGFGFKEALISMILCMILFISSYICRCKDGREIVATKPIIVRFFAYYVLIFSILFFGIFESSQFIYFQF